jgi:antitoxin HicB
MASGKNPHLGSSFDDFLREEGIANRVEELSAKKAIALGLQEYMDANGLSKHALAKNLHTSRSQLDRLLDPQNESVTLSTMRQVADIIGKRLIVTLEAA